MKIISVLSAGIIISAAAGAGINAETTGSGIVPTGAKANEEAMTVHSVHKGNNEGKILTMEETILSRKIYPARTYPVWNSPSTFTYRKDGEVYEYNVASGSEAHLTESIPDAAARIRAALPEGAANVTFSPDRTAAAFTSGHSLKCIDSMLHDWTVAESVDRNITYGQSVSRNEFGIEGGIFWSPDSRKIAFYRKDETLVTDFPLLDITTRTGSLKAIKYPMNGMSSENVRLGIYNTAANTTVYVEAEDFGYDQYLTNISWSPDSRYIFIQVLDRSQKNMNLNMYRADNGRFVKTILTEHNDRYVEPLDRLEWLGKTGKFIYRTDNRDGYRNLYLCDTLGNVDRLTSIDADVQFVAENGTSVFYTSAEISPVENHLFRVDVKVGKKGTVTVGKPVRLTAEEGWHNIYMNSDCTWFVDCWSSFNVPGETALRSADGKVSRSILSSEDPLKDYATGEMTLGTVRSADGRYDNWFRMYKPVNFDPSKKYPVVLYVYGGPHSQMVTDSWLGQIRMWEMYMAQKGYIVYVQDNRGTQNRGAEYEKAIHKYCGQAEMADQMAGIEALKTLPYVDRERIGVHGWSYGGFMTISLMTNYPETFKVGVAGGPVIDWKWYEVMYGERYMETARTNEEGFRETSLINKAKDLKGKLLICQGAIDNTVVWEHSLSFIRECIKNNVQVDYFPYPCAEHNVFGKDRVHLMDKVTMYFEDYLK
ncbi:MAG: DPP IV N-terminal domain-containing protein [Bacteroidales bacterium]|nr:DPP IV N-terminal domain-containing protein [Bacteroidales bacterium]